MATIGLGVTLAKAAVVAAEVEKRTGKKSRTCTLGDLQRTGGPTNVDRALCSAYGTKAVELIADSQYGRVVSFRRVSVRLNDPEE